MLSMYVCMYVCICLLILELLCLVRALGLDPMEQKQLLVSRTYNLTVVFPPTLAAQFSGALLAYVCMYVCLHVRIYVYMYVCKDIFQYLCTFKSCFSSYICVYCIYAQYVCKSICIVYVCTVYVCMYICKLFFFVCMYNSKAA